jgi:hypothetical protein
LSERERKKREREKRRERRESQSNNKLIGALKGADSANLITRTCPIVLETKLIISALRHKTCS